MSLLRRGPLYMTLAGLFFTVMVSLVKVAREDLSTLEVIFWRGFTSVPLAYILAARVGLRLNNVKLFVVRAMFGFAAMIGFFTAAKGLAVADLSLISKLQPIVIALLAPLALGAGERAGATMWFVLFAGVSGCALILAPDLALGSTYGLWALAATILSAAAHICVRGLARTDDARVIVLYFQAVAMVTSLGWLTIASGAPPTLPDTSLWPHLLGIGVTATAGQLCMTQAYAEDRAPVVAAASYTAPIWGVFADLLVFSTTPTWYTAVGGAIIVGAGLSLLFGKAGLLKATPEPIE